MISVFSPRHRSALATLLEYHRDRIPKDEYVELTAEEPSMLHCGPSELRVRLSRCRGYGVDAFYRSWSVGVPEAELIARDPAVGARAMMSAIDYLVAMVFGSPLPRFRLRHDARWGRDVVYQTKRFFSQLFRRRS